MMQELLCAPRLYPGAFQNRYARLALRKGRGRLECFRRAAGARGGRRQDLEPVSVDFKYGNNSGEKACVRWGGGTRWLVAAGAPYILHLPRAKKAKQANK